MKKPDRYFFPAVFSYEEGEEIAVLFPDLDVATSGTDDDDAFMSARECLGIHIYGMEEDDEPIPEPSKLSDIVVGKNERVVLVDVFMPSIRMAGVNRSVSRTVTLPAWMNAAAMEIGINFSQALQETLREKLQAFQIKNSFTNASESFRRDQC